MEICFKIDVKRYHSVQKMSTKKASLPVVAHSTAERTKKLDIVYYPYFETNRLPQSRQCIYQVGVLVGFLFCFFFITYCFIKYCDIRVPEIQEMLEKIPTPLTGATCNEKSGWLPANFDDHCREILSDIIRLLINKNKEEGNAALGADGEEEGEAEYPEDVRILLREY